MKNKISTSIVLAICLAGSIRTGQAQTTNNTEQILKMHTFREGLVLAGNQEPTAAENKELLEVLNHLDEEWWTAGLEQFFKDHPNSPWAASLHYDYASYCRRTGRTTKALGQYEAAWANVKGDTSSQGQRLSGTILANWTDLLSSLGRSDELKTLIAIGDQWHFVNPRDRDRFQGAKNSYDLMQLHPEMAFRCGTFALKAVGGVMLPGDDALQSLVEVPSPTNGFSMAGLADLAKQYGLNLVAVRRTAGQDLIVPSVVHWRQNHYAAILQKQDDGYLVSDPTFGSEKVLPAEVINEEASGEFLIPAAKETNGWTQLASNDAKTIHGMGLPNNVDDGKDKGCNANPSSCPACGGMPAWFVSEPYVNVWIADQPLSYLTSRGQPFTFQVTYKQRDTRPASSDYLVSTAGWNNSWASYIRLDSVSPCFNTHGTGCLPSLSSSYASVYLPNGGEADFNPGQSFDQETRLTLLQQNPELPLKNGYDYGDNGLRLVHADGSQDIYGLSITIPVPYGDDSEAEFMLTRRIDPNGDTTWFQYDSYGGAYLLTFVVDPDGHTNTLTYNTSSSLLLSVTNAYGKSANFKYDSSGNLTNIVDAQGLSSSIAYDTNNYPTKLITLYGTTTFNVFANSTVASTNDAEGNFGGDDLIDRAVQVTDPIGATSLYMYRYDCSSASPVNMATTFSSGNVPTGTPLGTLDDGSTGTNFLKAVCYRNSFYWGPRQFAGLSTTNMNSFNANDYVRGRMQHWLEDTNQLDLTGYLSVRQDASPDGSTAGLLTFYDYQGKLSGENFCAGTSARPSVQAWRLTNGDTHYEYWQFDSYGNTTNDITTYTTSSGSVGTRTNQFVFATNTYTDVIGTWTGSSLINTASSSFSIPNLLTKVIGADGDTIWAYGGFDTVTWTNFFYTGTQTNGVTLTSSRMLPDYATNGLGQVATTTYTSTGIPVNYYDMFKGSALGTNYNYGTLEATTFSGYNKVTSTITVAGLTTTNIYNANGFLSQTIDLQIGKTNSVSYTINGVLNTFTNELGLNLTLTWDSLLRQTSIQFPDGSYISNRYDKLDLTGVRDRLGNWTTYSYDGARHLVAVTNANNATTLYSWCNCGALTSILDPLGNTTSFNYDNQGNLTNASFADGTALSYQYDLAARPKSITDGANHSLQLAYNNQGSVTIVSNAFGLLQQITYDIRDRKMIITDANSVTATNTFDGLDRILTHSWPDGVAEGYGYSPQGLAFFTNRDQQVTFYGRDTATRVVAITNANQEVTRYSYDAANDQISMVDGLNHTNSWQYNQFGWITNKTDGIGRNATRFAYNANGWITNRWTPEKGNTAYAYDNVGNLLSVAYPQLTITYAYDAMNHLTNMIDAAGTTAFSYTQIGQLASENGPWANDTVGYTYSQGLRTALSVSQPSGSWSQTYNYDAAWRMTNTVSPAGAFGYSYKFQPASSLVSQILLPNGATITNSYDGLARLTKTALNNFWGNTLDGYSYQYDAFGLATNVTRNFGLTTSTVSAGYDRIGQILAWTAKEAGGNPRLNEQIGWAYDAADNLLRRTNNAFVQTFNVDAANELISVARAGTFTLNGATPAPATNVTVNGQPAQAYGDFTFARTNLSLVNGNNTFTNVAQNFYGVAATNILTVNLSTSVAMSYDSNGNLTNDGLRSLAFDSENQLTNATVTGQWRSDFVYDGLNRLRVARDYTWSGSSWALTNETHYVYDGSLIVQERSSNNIPLVTYTRGQDIGHSLQKEGGIGGLLARTDGSGSTFYHADRVGNVTALMDASQNIVARYLYNPYGKLLGKWGTLADANDMRYSSKLTYRDMDDFGLRWYAPELSRWANQDPIQELGGINLYAYIYNSPENLIDAMGLFPAGAAPPPPATWGGPYLNSPVGLGGGAAVAGEVSGAAVAGVAAAGVATAGLVAYDAYQASQVAALDSQNAQAEAHYNQEKADHDTYHKRCDETPPPGLNPCELAKWKLQREKDCIKLRTDFANKYFNGDMSGGHLKQIQDRQKSIDRLEDFIRKNCNPST